MQWGDVSLLESRGEVFKAHNAVGEVDHNAEELVASVS